MGFKAVDHSVNVIAFEKQGKKYAMTCAWAMMVDYDKLVCLIGAQSVTGKNICKNDFIGVSALNKKQKDIAERLGETHSDETDKLKDLEVEYNDSAYSFLYGYASIGVVANEEDRNTFVPAEVPVSDYVMLDNMINAGK